MTDSTDPLKMSQRELEEYLDAVGMIELDAAKRPVTLPGHIGRINTTITPACLPACAA
ncbi:hypothetical protein ACH4Y0_02440 [Streptomyces sp. NPDC020707]|uniref:hypothetical protein n=1 Tax=Streptomyces sp. NPDC020707 TaxID=3365084 RepID=UPI0037A304F6